MTAIINVNHGVVQYITWDDACLWCNKNQCEENTYDFNGNLGDQSMFQQPTKGCPWNAVDCATAMSNNQTDCDLLLYVVWTGTDANKKPFLSSAYRFSQFPAQQLANRFSNDIPSLPSLPKIPGFGGSPTAAPV